MEGFAGGSTLSSPSLVTILILFYSLGSLDGTHAAIGRPTDEAARADDPTEEDRSVKPLHHCNEVATVGLLETRMGAILIGTALLDDMVGVVMSRIVQVLGNVPGSLKPWTVIRAILGKRPI